MSMCGYGFILTTKQKDLLHVEPKQRYREGSEEEKENGSLQTEAKEGELLGSKGLAADGLHADGEAGEDGVAGNVGEADGEGAAGEGELAEAAEEEHGDHRTAVEKKAGENHGKSNFGYGNEFLESIREAMGFLGFQEFWD